MTGTSRGALAGVLVAAAGLALSRGAVADDASYIFRLATVAPDGSQLAHGLRLFAQDVAAATDGKVKLKWYYNGVAGDELEQGERIRKGQLDGSAGGQMLCDRLMPSMVVTRLPGVFQSRDEAADALDRLKPTLDKEARQRGFVLLSAPGLGPDIILTKTPVRSMAELRRLKLWRWDLDEVGIATSRAMGLQIVPLPVSEAARAYDEGRVDGFLAIPMAALAFQWSARAKYVTDLRGSYIWGCFIVTQASYDRLPAPYKRALDDAAAKARERYEEIGRRADDALLSGLFARQGVQTVPTSEQFRAEYMTAARDARERVAGKFVSAKLMDQVMQLLADYRLERPAQH